MGPFAICLHSKEAQNGVRRLCFIWFHISIQLKLHWRGDKHWNCRHQFEKWFNLSWGTAYQNLFQRKPHWENGQPDPIGLTAHAIALSPAPGIIKCAVRILGYSWASALRRQLMGTLSSKYCCQSAQGFWEQGRQWEGGEGENWVEVGDDWDWRGVSIAAKTAAESQPPSLLL